MTSQPNLRKGIPDGKIRARLSTKRQRFSKSFQRQQSTRHAVSNSTPKIFWNHRLTSQPNLREGIPDGQIRARLSTKRQRFSNSLQRQQSTRHAVSNSTPKIFWNHRLTSQPNLREGIPDCQIRARLPTKRQRFSKSLQRQQSTRLAVSSCTPKIFWNHRLTSQPSLREGIPDGQIRARLSTKRQRFSKSLQLRQSTDHAPSNWTPKIFWNHRWRHNQAFGKAFLMAKFVRASRQNVNDFQNRCNDVNLRASLYRAALLRPSGTTV